MFFPAPPRPEREFLPPSACIWAIPGANPAAFFYFHLPLPTQTSAGLPEFMAMGVLINKSAALAGLTST
jgi:hypothetical protein